MKAKYAIIIFLLGFICSICGAWLKITHFSYGSVNGNTVLTVGSLLESIGILLIIYKVLRYQGFKEFLNR